MSNSKINPDVEPELNTQEMLTLILSKHAGQLQKLSQLFELIRKDNYEDYLLMMDSNIKEKDATHLSLQTRFMETEHFLTLVEKLVTNYITSRKKLLQGIRDDPPFAEIKNLSMHTTQH